MPRCFVARRIPSLALDRLARHCQVDVWEGDLPPPREILMERVRGCDGLLTLLSDTIDDAVMEACGPQLRGIANFAVGYNNIDLAAATARGIAVGNTPDVLTEATADVALGLMIAAARRFQEGWQQVQQDQWRTWEPLGLLGHELNRRTLGIIGMGRIGLAVAMRCVGAWGMNIKYTARSPKPRAEAALQRCFEAHDIADAIDRGLVEHTPLRDLLAESDIISIHTDLNPTTRHLINREHLACMKRTAVLINTARGGIVDQVALLEALRDGTIFAAGLDVTDPEPLPGDSPLRTLPNCTILPHIGSATFTTRQAMANMAVDNLIAVLAGKPMPHAVK
jgi:lactate dehydrogenase-like 2-hydroxyacid dehydrogenase